MAAQTKLTKITLEDLGQDCLEFFVNSRDMIVDVQPFHAELYNGGFIPVRDKSMVEVGKPLPIHNPPHLSFGFLKYKIVKIEEITHREAYFGNDN